MFIKPIIIEPGSKTPEVIFDKENNIFQIKGRSISENAMEFYKPIKDWLAEYFSNPNPKTKLVFNFDYLNSSSIIQLTKIINIFENNYNKGKDALIVWQYERGDELIENTGIELNLIHEVPFVLEVYEPEDFEEFNFDIED